MFSQKNQHHIQAQNEVKGALEATLEPSCRTRPKKSPIAPLGSILGSFWNPKSVIWGNDFVIIDNREKITNLSKDQVIKICNRNFIGCDQLILIEKDNTTDASLKFFNSDGADIILFDTAGRTQIDLQMMSEIKQIEKIINPTLDGLKDMGIHYKGFLYAGLMIKNNEPYLIEYNVRMGDPECQTILPKLKTDLFFQEPILE